MDEGVDRGECRCVDLKEGRLESEDGRICREARSRSDRIWLHSSFRFQGGGGSGRRGGVVSEVHCRRVSMAVWCLHVYVIKRVNGHSSSSSRLFGYDPGVRDVGTSLERSKGSLRLGPGSSRSVGGRSVFEFVFSRWE